MTFKRHNEVVIWSYTIFFLFIMLVLIILTFQINIMPEIDDTAQKNRNFSVQSLSASDDSCNKEEAFAFIPAATVNKWAHTEFLIVFGTLSVDRDGQQRRRALQRATCWTFPGVATRANDYNGSMLVLYTLARHPAHGFALSESLRLEAAQWHDIVHLPVNEGRVTTNKQIGQTGHWGDEAAIGMGKKVFFWLELALRAFPLAIHVGKADDDIFMNVPQYLADLRILPRQGTYWGAYGGGMVLKNKEMELVDVKFMVGYAVALAKDVAEAIVTYKPLRRVMSLPYNKDNELDFLILNVNLDDVMVGRILNETKYPAIFVAEEIGCRFHNCRNENWSRNISEHSVVVHHLDEDEYHSFISYFIKTKIKIQNTVVDKISPTLYWVSCPIK